MLEGWTGNVVDGTYVCPSYSKIGSQPMKISKGREEEEVQVHIPKFAGPLAGTILPCMSSACIAVAGRRTYICSALEDNWLMTRSFAVGECTDSLGGSV